MTSPIQPPVDPQSPPVASPAPGVSGMDEEIRQLARALNVAAPEGLSACKGTVTAVSLGDASTAPTATVTVGGVSVPGVRLVASYTPTVGDTAVLLKLGNQYLAAFKVADVGSKSSGGAAGFIQANLAGGHTHNEPVFYRRVLDNGAWKMQWKGLLGFGGSANLLASALPAEYRPSGTRSVSIGIGRSANTAPMVASLEARTDGTVVFNSLSYSVNLGATDAAGDSHWHNHGGAVTATSFAETHQHGMGILTTSNPAWVSMDGVEYFL